MKDNLEKARQGHLDTHRGDSGGKLGRPSHVERQRRDHLGTLKRDDEWSDEARKKAAESRHLHMTATPETSSKPAFRASASSPAEMHTHLTNLHSHIKKNNLPTHNVSIENKHTGEVHSAKVAPRGIYQKTF